VLTLYVVDCVFKPWSGLTKDSIGGVIITVLTLYVVDCVFKPWLNNYTSDAVFGLTQPGFEHTIYHIQSEHTNNYTSEDSIGGVIISVLTLYVVDCVFKPWSGLTKDSIRGVIISVLTLYVVDCVFH
jgi:phosphotransferase system  glucose/maltose/N-acetylglucosamine-specific IIC component